MSKQSGRFFRNFCGLHTENLNKILPKNAVGEMIPVRFATRIVVPNSRNGDVKSTAASLSAFTLRDVSTMSNFLAGDFSKFFVALS